ncbi:MAG: thiamine-phosphate kinase [Chloroflexota bacterium]|nr:thiamine-phosphate kinase [Chloroflexota bacterium]
MMKPLAKREAPGRAGTLIGIGDDAAVWKPSRGARSIATTDLLVENVHFCLDYMDWFDVGWKAMAVNLSDIAAMGGRPLVALVTAGLRREMEKEQLRELFRGLTQCAGTYGTEVVGGDTVTSPTAAIVGVTVFGETIGGKAAHRVLRRDAAKAGDAVAVTGVLGSSAAGLRLLRQVRPRAGSALCRAHLRPQPRLEEGQASVRAGIACGMDISDGLLADLGKICAASRVGAIIQAEDVPTAVEVGRYFPEDALALALTGGEDYELVVCAPEEQLGRLPVSIVGRIVRGKGVAVVDAAGDRISFERAGYDAFL